jgi:hypothetical protein
MFQAGRSLLYCVDTQGRVIGAFSTTHRWEDQSESIRILAAAFEGPPEVRRKIIAAWLRSGDAGLISSSVYLLRRSAARASTLPSGSKLHGLWDTDIVSALLDALDRDVSVVVLRTGIEALIASEAMRLGASDVRGRVRARLLVALKSPDDFTALRVDEYFRRIAKELKTKAGIDLPASVQVPSGHCGDATDFSCKRAWVLANRTVLAAEWQDYLLRNMERIADTSTPSEPLTQEASGSDLSAIQPKVHDGALGAIPGTPNLGSRIGKLRKGGRTVIVEPNADARKQIGPESQVTGTKVRICLDPQGRITNIEIYTTSDAYRTQIDASSSTWSFVPYETDTGVRIAVCGEVQVLRNCSAKHPLCQ